MDDIKRVLNDSPLIRHLFNKLGTQVTVLINKEKIIGDLASIDVHRKFIEISVEGETFFLNMRRLDYIKTKTKVLRNEEQGY
jgi:hypothetical protein